LSDETRLRVVHLLRGEDLCVCQISGILEVPQPKVSKALSKLRDLKLVNDERKDKFVYYSLKEKTLLLDILEDVVKSLDDYPQLQEDKARLAIKDSFLSTCETKPINIQS
jgi:ArsR family transcriptional regulator